MSFDPVSLTQELIRFPSVTPLDAGVQKMLARRLEEIGFKCQHLRFEEAGTDPIDNLYARLGSGPDIFCFAGHTDVVPAGNPEDWSAKPFSGDINGDTLFGRGAVDMKGGIGAFIASVKSFLDATGYTAETLPGSISLLITGDEEDQAINGTCKVLNWMREQGEVPNLCVVGEPTNPTVLGEMVKIGRRGSMVTKLKVKGIQGHVAYPHLADNPLPRLAKILSILSANPLDMGNDHFQQSTLQITSINVENDAINVIPAEGEAVFDIRYNTEHTAQSLQMWIHNVCKRVGGAYDLDFQILAEPFVTPPGPLSTLVSEAIEAVTGQKPQLSTTGGTSDARFIKNFCPVVEFGLVGQTMHKIDECVAISDLCKLAEIYQEMLHRYFKAPEMWNVQQAAE